jgi:hypothetical protein
MPWWALRSEPPYVRAPYISSLWLASENEYI